MAKSIEVCKQSVIELLRTSVRAAIWTPHRQRNRRSKLRYSRKEVGFDE